MPSHKFFMFLFPHGYVCCSDKACQGLSPPFDVAGTSFTLLRGDKKLVKLHDAFMVFSKATLRPLGSKLLSWKTLQSKWFEVKDYSKFTPVFHFWSYEILSVTYQISRTSSFEYFCFTSLSNTSFLLPNALVSLVSINFIIRYALDHLHSLVI